MTGVDVSPRMIDAARTLVPTATFSVMDMNDLTFAPSTFDGVLTAYSFLHIPKMCAPNVLTGFHRIVRPAGVLGLMVKEGRGEHRLPASLVPGETCYVQLWTQGELLVALNSAGFDVDLRESAAPRFAEELQYARLFVIAHRSDKAS